MVPKSSSGQKPLENRRVPRQVPMGVSGFHVVPTRSNAQQPLKNFWGLVHRVWMNEKQVEAWSESLLTYDKSRMHVWTIIFDCATAGLVVPVYQNAISYDHMRP